MWLEIKPETYTYLSMKSILDKKLAINFLSGYCNTTG